MNQEAPGLNVITSTNVLGKTILQPAIWGGGGAKINLDLQQVENEHGVNVYL